MTALTFPSNPQTGDIYQAPNNLQYYFDGVKWIVQTTTTTSQDITNFVQDAVAPVFENIQGSGITFNYDTDTNTLTANVAATGGVTPDAVYTYQAGQYITDPNVLAAAGKFATQTSIGWSEDTISEVTRIYFNPTDHNNKNLADFYSTAYDNGINALLKVTDANGNAVARYATTRIGGVNDSNGQYNGYYITIARMFGNGTPNKAKITITTVQPWFNGDWGTNSDWALWGGLSSSSDATVLIIYGEDDQNPIPMNQLWTFATNVVDTILAGTTVDDRKTAFYNSIDNIISSALPPNTLFRDFTFFNQSTIDINAGNSTLNSPGGGNGASFAINWDTDRYWVNRSYGRNFSGGTGYAAGDTYVALGSLFGGEDVTNDLTLTVNEVDANGSIRRFTVTGTPLDTTVVWPNYSIDDGGQDQEDNANKFYTSYTGNNAGEGHDRSPYGSCTLQAVSYAGGATTSGEGIFTDVGVTTSEYSVAYKSSVFALFVTGNQSDFIETDGNSGFDGESKLTWDNNPNWLAFYIEVKLVEGSGAWIPGQNYNFTYEIGGALGDVRAQYNTLYTIGNGIYLLSQGGEGNGYVYVPTEQNLNYNAVEVANYGYTNNNIYENGGVMVNTGGKLWRFKRDINNTNRPYGTDAPYVQYPNDDRKVSPQGTWCQANMDTVVYTATDSWISSFKLFIQAEGSPPSAPNNYSQYWESQASDAIITTTTYDFAKEPAMTVYGRVYTGSEVLAEYTVRRNTTSNRIEVVARPTATNSNYGVYVKLNVTEIYSYND